VIRLAALLPAALLAVACDPIGDVCFNCGDSGSNAPLASADAARLRLIHGGTLPAGASNVYYTEQCGIDCIQWIRFDIPAAEWEPLLTRLREGAEGRSPDIVSEIDGPPGAAWWRVNPPAGVAEHVALVGPQGWPLALISYRLDARSIRVFLTANQM
jgi:hypothetical protein